MKFKGVKELYHQKLPEWHIIKKRNIFKGLLIIILTIIIGRKIILDRIPNDELYWLIGSFVLGTGVSLGLVVMFFTYHDKKIHDTSYNDDVYYVTIDDDVKLKAFYEKYEIKDKNGDIWIVTKRKEEDE